MTLGTALADNSKISPDLLPLLSNPSAQHNVIVQYNSPPQTCQSGGLLGLGGLICTAVKILGGIVHVVFDVIDAVFATLSGGDIITLSNQSNVTYISLDRSVAGTLDYTAAAVDAPLAWSYGLDGTGIGIAIIDSGVYSHPDLASRVVYRQNFTGGGVQYDDYGHGTHVAGIAAGNGKVSNGPGSFRSLRGIASNANILDLRVLDKNGMSSDSVIIAAIQQAVQLKSKYNVRVINLSLGRPIYESCNRDPLCKAVEAAWKAGIVVVTAAGNLGRNGYATVLSPGNSPRAITVGCMKTFQTYPKGDDLIASYSSKGPTYIDLTVKPDVVAPGNLVVSLLAPGSTLQSMYPGNVIAPSYYSTSTSPAAGGYFRLSGTSMATPVVTGAVALMLQKNPSLTPDTVKARLMKTAAKNFPMASVAVDPTTGQAYPSTYDIFTIGSGYLDVVAALANTDVAQSSAASPSVAYNLFTKTASLQSNSSTIWGSNAVWGDGTVWGTSTLVNGTSAVWGSNAVWGDSGNWGTNAVWGDTSGATASNAVWGDTNGVGEK
jgi:serine protease AprX